jgi:hypothetical protein
VSSAPLSGAGVELFTRLMSASLETFSSYLINSDFDSDSEIGDLSSAL